MSTRRRVESSWRSMTRTRSSSSTSRRGRSPRPSRGATSRSRPGWPTIPISSGSTSRAGPETIASSTSSTPYSTAASGWWTSDSEPISSLSTAITSMSTRRTAAARIGRWSMGRRSSRWVWSEPVPSRRAWPSIRRPTASMPWWVAPESSASITTLKASALAALRRVDHAPGVHEECLQRRVADVTEAAISPLAPPAVGKLERAVALVEADDADRVTAEEFDAGIRHRDDAARCIHERLVHHDAGDEAIRHQVRLHLDDAGEPRVALRPVRRGGTALLRGGWHIDALHGIGHTGEAADPLVLDDLHRLADRHPRISGLLAPLAVDVQRRELVRRIVQRPVMLKTLLERLVVVGRGAGDAGAGRALVEDRRQRRRMIDLFDEGHRAQERRHAQIPMVVGILDAAEGVASRHRGCDGGAAMFR